MAGDSTLFVRRDEAEKAWEWVDDVSRAWAESAVRLEPYAAGTWGPVSARKLLTDTDRAWNKNDV